jgi:hypothetical protein
MNASLSSSFTRSALLIFSALIVTACGSGSNTSLQSDSTPVAACDPADASTSNECGTVLIGFTDADGDFLNYTVDVVKLSLETANGRSVEVLPQQTRINFTDYVELTELVTAASVPPATYVSGTISLDYSDSEVVVESGDHGKAAIVTDSDGAALQRVDLRIVLSNRDRLTVVKGRAALLQLDFDLEASHEVDIVPTPATAVAEHFILAEVHPVDEKDIRVRGPLLAVNEVEKHYVVAIRPFHDRDGDFGRVVVNISEHTEFELNGTEFVGAEGLQALGAAGQGTATIALGTLTVADRSFTAARVLAGSSVPGSELDAVVGNVIQRNGNYLTVRGATIIPRHVATDRRIHFHDDVVVEVGPNTKVFRDGQRNSDLAIDAISIGQRISVRGNQNTSTIDASSPQILFDATEGAVRMHVTHLAGIVNTVMPGQTDITLHAIDRRRSQIFDFTGTGASAELDADPENYEISTGNLTLADFASGRPIVAYGFPAAFGMAPADFDGRTVIDFVDVRSTLGIAWGSRGTMAPFASLSDDGIVLALENGDIGNRHHLKQGPLLIDLLSLGTNTTILPNAGDRTLFSIKTADSLRLYSDFADFIADLGISLNGATTARSMYARGDFDVDSNTIKAYKIGVLLSDPPM